ncbi:MAG TPA: TerB family tellurite resistance protein, partial [Cyanobacteria bacterium UBA8156]|nr:TerB family tellurite resistance protein [Cyanobacteria bacterium UBA8156]
SPLPLPHQRQLLEIAIGAAWLDGTLAPGEVAYLEQLLRRYNLAHDPDLQALLAAPVPPGDTNRRLLQFLDRTTAQEREIVLAAVANTLFADAQIQPAERDFLDRFHALMAQIPPDPEHHPSWLETLGKGVRQAARTVTGWLQSE